MWWSKTTTKDSSASTPSEPEVADVGPSDVEFDQAADTIGAILRSIGERAFDTDCRDGSTVRMLCEGWARHVLVLAPSPGAPKGEGRTTAQRREWVRVRRFAAEAVREQSDYAQRALESLREAVWAFIRTLSEAVAEERGEDTRVQEKLDRLRSAVDSANPEQLRQEVSSAVHTISHVLQERKRKRLTNMAELGRKLRALSRELEQAKREGAIDPLTRVLNRKSFDDFAERTTQLAGLFQTPACLLMVDLDHFKAVNDTYGHPVGDEVLRMVADSLTRCFLRKGDLVARYGGEEFAVILSETELRDAKTLAGRMCAAIGAAKLPRADVKVSVTCSVGVAEVAPGETPAEWVARADAALYAAKHGGRNRVVAAEAEGRPNSAPPKQEAVLGREL